MPITDQDLNSKVKELLNIIYEKRIANLSNLQLRRVLLKKNPYMYRAIGSGDAKDLVKLLLDATISSSDETIFGNEFFEPLAVWVASHSGMPGAVARASSAEGADLDVEFPDQYRMYAIKSGKAVFNADSWKRQLTNFSAARLRLAKTKKHFDPVIGYGYGRSTSKRDAREVAGQAFWEEISGEPNFYLRIIRAMDTGSVERQSHFLTEYDKAATRFLNELLANFANEEGSLDWERLLEYNSSIAKPAPRSWKEKVNQNFLAETEYLLSSPANAARLTDSMT
jgi:hypothetical protein